MVAKWLLAAPLMLVALAPQPSQAALECNNWSSRFQKKIEGVCVCNEKQCDSVSNEYLDLKEDEASIYRTSKSGDRLRHEKLKFLDGNAGEVDFTMDANAKFQKIIGFGGAFTDSTAINVYRLKPTLQQQLVDAYYSDSGIQYTIGRIPIGSADFSESIYSYNPSVDDFDMAHFSIDVDREPTSHKLSLIKRALSTSTRDISIFASSWAPPTWMTVQNKTQNCNVKGSPGGSYWKALALYYSKFLTAYKDEGIDIWGMTVQNEPDHPIIQPNAWQSLRMTTETERDFIKSDLGPILKANHPDVKLIVMDDNKAHLPKWQAALKDPEARKYVDGIGLHWYMNFDFPLGLGGNFKEMRDFHAKYPDVFMLPTEACEGYLPKLIGTGAGVRMHEFNVVWSRAHNYAKDIINDLINYASGWTDWNLALDMNGGPNWAGNFVDAPILVDEKNGDEFYKQPMYYVLGQFSKFVTSGSQRIGMEMNKSLRNLWRLRDLSYVAFQTPENRYAVVFYNSGDSDEEVKLMTPSKKVIKVIVARNSLQTLVFSA
ncbi:TPA: hypothetical protein N0F65_000686 [Lagenidium giganteum]|uniref:Glucosylceramidase n=1 Tax=Lagenidium giganteum TaxID=4803 RepID=A0AAV2YYY7_9STRA|nr:TPA: hypothetical protein N0F65_000686 [Lagenidium giganteum]